MWLEVCHDNVTGLSPREVCFRSTRRKKSRPVQIEIEMSYGRACLPYCFFAWNPFFLFPCVMVIVVQSIWCLGTSMLYDRAHDMPSALDSGTSLGNTGCRGYEESVQGSKQG